MTTGSSEASDRVVVVAKVSRTTIAIVAFLALPTIYALVTTPNLGWAMVLIAHAAVLHRVTQISVSVSQEGVLVRNLLSTTLVPIWEAETEVEESDADATFFLSDAGGKYDNSGRTLYVRRPWNGTRVHVTAAPRFGDELDRINSQLNEAIRAKRAA